ncbi:MULTISPECIES: beta strand repeat-containing protein [unclassified Myroides]|uniref:beta strand repeat-containing protein n=1 Tax=unclassified Myroides TaxID=2642485 RepID=UPI003100B09E
MNRKITLLSALLLSGYTFGQVGIGIERPAASSMLDIAATSDADRGLLIPRINLTDLKSSASFAGGKAAESLLVYNLGTKGTLPAGYYYWMGGQWVRLINSEDVKNLEGFDTHNKEMAVNLVKKTLFVKDSKDQTVEVPLKDINIVSTLEDGEKGIFTYTDETNRVTKIDIPFEVIDNIHTIVNDPKVIAEILLQIKANARHLEGDSIINVEKGERAVLNDVKLSVKDKSITPSKLKADKADVGKVLMVDKDGDVYYAVILQENAKNESIAVESKDGKLDASSVLFITDSDGDRIDIALSELNIVSTLKDIGEGKFEYVDEKGAVVIIDIPNSVIKNIDTILKVTEVQDSIYNTIATKGQKINTDSIIAVTNGDKAVLSEITLSVTDHSITKDKLIATVADAGKALVVNEDGKLHYAILDGKNTVISTFVVDGDNLTITDSEDDSFPVPLSDINIDTYIINDSKGNYTYYNEAKASYKIQVVTDVVNNIQTILGDKTVQENIYTTVASQGRKLSSNSNIIEVSGGDNAVLNNVILSVKDKSITKDKLIATTADAGKVLMVDDKGEFYYAKIADENTKNKAFAVTKIGGELNKNSEFSLEDTDKHKVNIKLSELNIVTTLVKGVDGKYTYTDEQGVVSTIDIPTDVIDNITTILGNETVQNSIYATVANQGKGLKTDASLKVEGVASKALLSELSIKVDTGGIKNEHIASRAVTQDKISAIGAVNGAILVSEGGIDNPMAKFESAETVVSRVAKGDIVESESIAVEGGKDVLFGQASKDAKLSLKTGGVKNEHLAVKSVTKDKIDSKEAERNTVLTADGNGNVTYQALTSDMISTAEKLSTTGPIKVSNEDNKATLQPITVSLEKGGITNEYIGNKSVTTDKISSTVVTGNAKRGEVLTADGNGNVTYSPIENIIAPKAGNLQSDGIISVSGKTEATGETNGDRAVLKDIYLAITDKGISTEKLADKAVTTKQLNAEGANKNTVLTVVDGDKVAYQAITGDMITTAGEIKTDGIVSVSEGANKVLADVTLGITDKTVTATKLVGPTGTANLVATTDAAGTVTYKAVTSDMVTGAGNITTDNVVTVVNGTGKVLSDVELGLADTSITTAKLVDKAVTTDKISSVVAGKTAAENQVLTADGQGGTYYKGVDTIFNEKSAKLSTTGPIVIDQVDNKATLQPVNISLADKGVTNEFIGDNAVTTDKIGSGTAADKTVLTADGQGNVAYKSFGELQETGSLKADNSISVSSETQKAILGKDITLKVNDRGIQTKHIDFKAVTTDLISSKDIDATTNSNFAGGDILTADGSGGVAFQPVSNAVKSSMKGDIVGNESIEVDGGENVLFGADDKKTALSLKTGGVKNTHLAAGSVEESKIATSAVTADKVSDKAITNAKLFGGIVEGADNRVAISNAEGNVTYKQITTDVIASKGNLSGDAIIAVDNGKNKTLGDVNLSVKDNSIEASKFKSTGATVGTVATADGAGKVNYLPITSASITDKGNITTDGIVTVDDGVNKLLANVKLGIADAKITETQLANNAVTTDKIADGAVTTDKIGGKNVTIEKLGSEEGEGKILVTDGNGGFVYSTVAAEQTEAHDITTDGIIGFGDGQDGKGVVLQDIELKINENSITKSKLTSENQPVDRLLVTDGNGGFDYVVKEAVQAGGVDMSVGSSLEFINGTEGKNAVLALTSIDVKDQGITTTKLADKAVTTAKINSEGAAENTVLTADGSGNVAYKGVGELVFDQGENLTADGSISVTANNKALLKATEIKIANQGVDNEHIKVGAVQTAQLADNAVTTAKINPEGAAENTVLTVTAGDKVAYKGMDELVFSQGEALSGNGAIEVKTGAKALLKAASIDIKTEGVQTEHLKNKAVTASKISSESETINHVLIADGNGGAKFTAINNLIDVDGKNLSETANGAIEITGGENAVLKDVSIGVRNGGITNAKIANKNITATKMNSEKSSKGTVLTSLGDGEAQYLPLNTNAKTLDSDTSIKVTNAGQSVLNDVSIQVADGGIENKHIAASAVKTTQLADKAVTAAKISSKKGATTNEAANTVLTADGSGNVAYKAVSEVITKGDLGSKDTTIKVTSGNGAVLTNVDLAINESSILGKHIVGQQVDATKLGAPKTANLVPVSNADGTVEYKAIKAVVDNNAEDLVLGNALEFVGDATGKKAVNSAVNIQVKKEGITTDLLAGNAVTNGKLADNAVSTSKVVTNAITTDKLGNAAVTSAKIGESAVLESKLANGAVTNTKLAAGAVTVDKVSTVLPTGNAATDAVLSADGNGGAVYKSLGTLVVNHGQDLKADGSIEVAPGNKALIKETEIKIATEGVATNHLQNHSVTKEKISSKVGDSNAVANTVLTAKGDGTVSYKGMDELLFDNGKAVTSTENSIKIENGDKAVLKLMKLDIADGGVQTKHLVGKSVTPDKINSVGKPENHFLVSDGKGATAFKDINSMLELGGAELSGPGAIEVTDGDHALLNAASIDVRDGGITTDKIADGAIVNDKIAYRTINPEKIRSASNDTLGVLRADGKGAAAFTRGKKLTLGHPLQYGEMESNQFVLLSPLSIQLAPLGITSGFIGEKAVTYDKISSGKFKKGSFLIADGKGGAEYGIPKDYGKALTSSDNSIEVDHGIYALVDPASIKIADGGVKEKHIGNREVHETKISSVNKNQGTVLVADGNGGASFQELKAAMPKFFYMPSIALEVKANETITKDIYADYFRQFSAPMYSSVGIDGKLPVLPANELNYHITYYDTTVFEIVSLSEEGVLVYKVKGDGVVTGKTFMNIVLEVK